MTGVAGMISYTTGPLTALGTVYYLERWERFAVRLWLTLRYLLLALWCVISVIECASCRIIFPISPSSTTQCVVHCLFHWLVFVHGRKPELSFFFILGSKSLSTLQRSIRESFSLNQFKTSFNHCTHYENMPIQIHWQFYYQKMKIFR